MYNFNLHDGEELVKVFDEEYVKQGDNDKTTTIAVTNKRILFLDFPYSETDEMLRIGRGADYVRIKEVYYQIERANIDKVIEDDYYKVILKDKIEIEFDNKELVDLIK